MISTASEPSGYLWEASGEREKEVHTGTGVNIGPLLRPMPLNPTVLTQGHSLKNALGDQVAKLIPSPLTLGSRRQEDNR